MKTELKLFEVIERTLAPVHPPLKEIAAKVDEKEAEGWCFVCVTAGNQILMRRDTDGS